MTDGVYQSVFYNMKRENPQNSESSNPVERTKIRPRTFDLSNENYSGHEKPNLRMRYHNFKIFANVKRQQQPLAKRQIGRGCGCGVRIQRDCDVIVAQQTCVLCGLYLLRRWFIDAHGIHDGSVQGMCSLVFSQVNLKET